MALTDKLIAIADAIRGKTGGTDTMTLDQMATEIAGIEDGGGGVAIQSGSFTPAENLGSYTISVSGLVKNFILWKNTSAMTYGVRTFVSAVIVDGCSYPIVVATNASGTSSTGYTGAKCVNITEGKVELFWHAQVGYLVTEQYNWVAW